jgi:hypothetical protein
LLKDLIANQTTAARVTRIREELNLAWVQGHANGCRWRGREPSQNDDIRR